MVKIINPKKKETIIDPTCGIGDFLSSAYVNSQMTLDDNNIFGADNDRQMIELAELNMLLNGDGNANLEYLDDEGSIFRKFDEKNDIVELNSNLHKNGNWDNWNDKTSIKKFDIVLTNPPFGKNRSMKPANIKEKERAEIYELWNIARDGQSIDKGLIFLENTVRILKENGRFGIILSNSLASVETWKDAREWLTRNIRIVGLFDLPANVFADTGVYTTIIIGYKPNKQQL
jgi:Type I restriction-modification system methyltransferase subunit